MQVVHFKWLNRSNKVYEVTTCWSVMLWPSFDRYMT